MKGENCPHGISLADTGPTNKSYIGKIYNGELLLTGKTLMICRPNLMSH